MAKTECVVGCATIGPWSLLNVDMAVRSPWPGVGSAARVQGSGSSPASSPPNCPETIPLSWIPWNAGDEPKAVFHTFVPNVIQESEVNTVVPSGPIVTAGSLLPLFSNNGVFENVSEFVGTGFTALTVELSMQRETATTNNAMKDHRTRRPPRAIPAKGRARQIPFANDRRVVRTWLALSGVRLPMPMRNVTLQILVRNLAAQAATLERSTPARQLRRCKRHELDAVREPPLREGPLNGGLAALRNPEDELVFGREAPTIIQQLVFRIRCRKILAELCFPIHDLGEVVHLNIRHHVGDRIRGSLDVREPLGREPLGQSFSHQSMLGTLGFPDHTGDKPTART